MAALGLITIGAQAKVKLPHILSDNMILQQNTEASLWGWDKPGTTVEVTTSWSGQKYSAKTGKDGKWAIKVQTPKASYTPLSITFDDGEKTTLNSPARPPCLRQGRGQRLIRVPACGVPSLKSEQITEQRPSSGSHGRCQWAERRCPATA